MDSQRIQQTVVVPAAKADETIGLERMSLFKEDGSPFVAGVGPAGAAGAQGPAGAAGAQGPAGPAGPAADPTVISNSQVASYTPVLSDAGKVVEMNAAGATVLTVPPNSGVAFPIGTVFEVARMGAGAVSVAAGAGVTIRSRGGLLAVGSQYAGASLRKRATDEWVLVGDLA